MARVAKCLLYDGATELCAVRLDDGFYSLAQGPVVDNQAALIGQPDSNYTTIRLKFQDEVERLRKVLL